MELDLARFILPESSYLRGLVTLLVDDRKISPSRRARISSLREGCGLDGDDPVRLRRTLNTIRNLLLAELGAAPAEWDLLDLSGRGPDEQVPPVLPICVYLEDIRSPFNVGSIFRSSECFGVKEIYLSPDTPSPIHPRALKSARGTVDRVAWSVRELRVLEEHGGVFALETGGVPVQDFAFPDSGVVIVGSEELGVSPEALGIAGGGAGRVTIPLAGAKRSLNVSVAFGILLHWWRERLTRGD